MTLKVALILFFLVSVPAVVKTDLPVHCTMDQVAGDWKFYLGASTSAEDVPGPASCGSAQPNENTDNVQKIGNGKEFLQQTRGINRDPIQVSLTTDVVPFCAVSDSECTQSTFVKENWKRLAVRDTGGNIVGYWTMAFDEGFDVTIGKQTYFAFSSYSFSGDDDDSSGGCSPKDTDGEDSTGHTECYVSNCSQTLIGWVHGEDGSNCFYGEKEDRSGGYSFVVVNPRSTQNNILSNYHSSFVEEHNKSNETWTAKMYSFLQSEDELKSRLKGKGYQRFHSADPLKAAFLQRNSGSETSGLYACAAPTTTTFTDGKIQKIPPAFSWVGKIPEPGVIDQGACGSCYAIASTYSLSARFHLALADKAASLGLYDGDQDKIASDYRTHVNLSPQNVLSCSYYNQGCSGGYPFLVGKWAKEVGIPSVECAQYEASDHPPCTAPRHLREEEPDSFASGCEDLFYAKSYDYVGGFYEHTNADFMKEEIMTNGPIVVAFDSPTELLYYNDGVFNVTSQNHHSQCEVKKDNEVNGWEYTDHAVVIMGWDQCGPGCWYWIVRNSWGEKWGQVGTVKVIGGKNMGGIENQSVSITPDLTRGQAKKIIDQIQQEVNESKQQSQLRNARLHNPN